MNVTGTFERSKILLTEKLTNGALVTPTPYDLITALYRICGVIFSWVVFSLFLLMCFYRLFLHFPLLFNVILRRLFPPFPSGVECWIVCRWLSVQMAYSSILISMTQTTSILGFIRVPWDLLLVLGFFRQKGPRMYVSSERHINLVWKCNPWTRDGKAGVEHPTLTSCALAKWSTKGVDSLAIRLSRKPMGWPLLCSKHFLLVC